MGEADRQQRRAEFQKEAREIKTDEMWETLLMDLKNLAETAGIPVTHFLTSGKFSMEENARPLYSVRINPVRMDEEGNPIIVVLDGEFRGRHTQQVVLTAQWEDDFPIVDPTYSSFVNSRKFSYKILAAAAIEKIGELADQASFPKLQATSANTQGVTVRMPPSYAPGIN